LEERKETSLSKQSELRVLVFCWKKANQKNIFVREEMKI
jgi:hypothetical protein